MGTRLPVASTKDQGLILIGSLVIPMADPNLIKWEEWNPRDAWIRKIWVDGQEIHPHPRENSGICKVFPRTKQGSGVP